MELAKELQNATFHDILARAAAKWPNKPGLIFDQSSEHITFLNLYERVKKITAVLKNQGIQVGKKVALMLPNIAEFPLTWLSLGIIGATMVPINIRYQIHDSYYILNHSEASLVITVSEKVDMLQKVRNEHKLTYLIMTVDKLHKDADLHLPLLLNTISDVVLNENVHPETLMNIQYTSGTTGFPKGCMLTQKYWINIGTKLMDKPFPHLSEKDTLLTAQPYYYIDPQWNTIAAIITGATLVVLDRFSPSTFFDKIRKYKVTFFYCLGSMPALLLKMPESKEDRNHHLRFIGCSAIPSILHHQLENRWGVKWFEIFGMTETGYDLSMSMEEHDKYIGKGALGRPTYDREARVVGDNDIPVKRGEIGELVLRGIGMMDGYFKNPEATRSVFQNGWFHTGDLVRMDEDGMFYYIGRKKDMIRRSGENISAVEVEEVMMNHKSVKLAACIPIEDEIRGEEIKAHIIPAEKVTDSDTFIHSIIEHCKIRLASYKIPRYWELRDELPLTPSERVAKHLLKKEKENILIYTYDRIEKKWLN